MVPVQAFIDSINELVRTDTEFLAATDANRVALVVAEFTPNPALVLASLTLATFPGYAVKDITIGSQTLIYDSVSGRYGILLREPIGGLNFVCTGTPTPPETVYGYALIRDDNVLIATALLPTPIVIAAVGNSVSVPAVFGYLSYVPYSDL